MADNKQIVVSENAGLIDGIQSAVRYFVVVVGFFGAVLALVKARDIAGLIVYIQNNGGEALGAVLGLISLGTAAYGIGKTWLRGKQVADVAGDPTVPAEVATLK